MVDDGLMDRFGIQEVYGMHNMPGMPVGEFAHPARARCWPPATASTSTITGKGGHAARPHECIDPVLVGSHIVTALQSIVSRNVDPLQSGVVSICMFHAGEAYNVIPETAELSGTARTLDAGGARPASSGASWRWPRRRPSCTAPRPRRPTAAAIP